jgi:hypothetical protein
MSAYRMLRERVATNVGGGLPSILPTLFRVNEPRRPRRERRRRWFSNEDFDLFVWFDDLGAIAGFELCYDRSDVERALSWSPTRGYRHWRVDTGEATGLSYDMTPILEPDDTDFPKDRVIAAFVEAADALEPAIRSFVVQRLQEVA